MSALMMPVIFVHCHRCKGKYDLVVVKTENMVTILGSSRCFCSTEVLRTLISAGAKVVVCLPRVWALPQAGWSLPSTTWSHCSHSRAAFQGG